MVKSLSEFVRERAQGCCEYCLVPLDAYETPGQIDHIVAVKHGGRDEPPNLALACFHCNLHKGTNLAGMDRKTGEMVRLFHPRKDRWVEHFFWLVPGKFEARTAVGRVTIAVLRMNDPLLGQVREMLAEEGRFPPGIWKPDGGGYMTFLPGTKRVERSRPEQSLRRAASQVCCQLGQGS